MIMIHFLKDSVTVLQAVRVGKGRGQRRERVTMLLQDHCFKMYRLQTHLEALTTS